MSHQVPMTSRPAVEPALVTRALRALCTILVAATFAACSPPSGPRPAASPSSAPNSSLPPIARMEPDLARGMGGGSTMGFYVASCLYAPQPGTDCLNLIFGLGTITERTPADFDAFTQKLDRVLPHGLAGSGTGQWAVVLDSPGGDVGASLVLGRDIRHSHWNTITGYPYPLAGTWRTATCASACVYTFAGGVMRGVFTDNALGVHQFITTSPRVTVAQVQYTTAMISAYLVEMGVSANVQALAGLTAAQTVMPLTVQDAITFGLATHRS